MDKNSFVPSIKVIFSLSADEFSLDEVTSILGVPPTKTRTKDSFPPNGLAHTEWSLEYKENNCEAVSIVFKIILAILSGKANAIKRICDNLGLEAGFEVVIHMKDGDTPAVILHREVIAFAASINAEIGFDIYCYE